MQPTLLVNDCPSCGAFIQHFNHGVRRATGYLVSISINVRWRHPINTESSLMLNHDGLDMGVTPKLEVSLAY